MIHTLLITLILEELIIAGYCAWKRQPAGELLLSGFSINIFTQAILWMVLRLFFQYYLPTLLVAEVLIWIVEGVLLRYLSKGRLDTKQAFGLSLMMNAASLGVGWWLAV